MLIPIPGANASGRFAKKPIIKQDIKDEAAVAVVRLRRRVDKHSAAAIFSELNKQSLPRIL